MSHIVAVQKEFVGLGRSFMHRSLSGGRPLLDEQMRHLNVFRKRFANGQTLRPADMYEFDLFWEKNSAATLQKSIERDRNKRIYNRIMLTAGHHLSDEWRAETEEYNINVLAYRIELTRRRLNTCAAYLLSASLHALARRYQRDTRTDDTTIRDELLCITLQADTIQLDEQARWKFQGWRGVKGPLSFCIQDETYAHDVLYVRTYV